MIRLSRRHTPWRNVGLRALLKGPTAMQILSWPHQGSNHRSCRSMSSSLTTRLQAVPTFMEIGNGFVHGSQSSSRTAGPRTQVAAAQVTGSYRPQDAGSYRPQDTGSYRPQDAGSSRPQDAGSSRPQDTGSCRPQDAGSCRPKAAVVPALVCKATAQRVYSWIEKGSRAGLIFDPYIV